MPAFLISLLRTAVPAAWGWIVLRLIDVGVPGGPLAGLGPAVEQLVTAGAVVAWYFVWRLAERYLPDWLTALVLGHPAAPVYQSALSGPQR